MDVILNDVKDRSPWPTPLRSTAPPHAVPFVLAVWRRPSGHAILLAWPPKAQQVEPWGTAALGTRAREGMTIEVCA